MFPGSWPIYQRIVKKGSHRFTEKQDNYILREAAEQIVGGYNVKRVSRARFRFGASFYETEDKEELIGMGCSLGSSLFSLLCVSLPIMHLALLIHTPNYAKV